MSFLWRSSQCSDGSLQQNNADVEQLYRPLCRCGSGSETPDYMLTNVICKIPSVV